MSKLSRFPGQIQSIDLESMDYGLRATRTGFAQAVLQRYHASRFRPRAGCGKNPPPCHSEEPKAVLSAVKEESRKAFTFRARFLATLGMTRFRNVFPQPLRASRGSASSAAGMAASHHRQCRMTKIVKKDEVGVFSPY